MKCSTEMAIKNRVDPWYSSKVHILISSNFIEPLSRKKLFKNWMPKNKKQVQIPSSYGSPQGTTDHDRYLWHTPIVQHVLQALYTGTSMVHHGVLQCLQPSLNMCTLVISDINFSFHITCHYIWKQLWAPFENHSKDMQNINHRAITRYYLYGFLGLNSFFTSHVTMFESISEHFLSTIQNTCKTCFVTCSTQCEYVICTRFRDLISHHMSVLFKAFQSTFWGPFKTSAS
jgi:hypothetical protein